MPVAHIDYPLPQEKLSDLRRKLKVGLVPKNTNLDTVYIAGPMRGLPEYNYPAFRALAFGLRNKGFIVNCPAENFGGDQTRDFSEYMALDLQMLLDSDGIVLMPGWHNSEGAKLEASIAKALDYDFYEASLTGEGPNGEPPDPYQSESWAARLMPTPQATVSGGIDAEARSLVYGARNADYGPPGLDFTVVGRIWAALLSAHTQATVDDIPASVVGLMLAGLKLGRLGRTPDHRDGRVDLIGYALCVDRIVTNDGADV